ncbi:MAG: hypothetical protein JST32_03115 [Bacteroidetes bacterium]|nr:hypothetical protein [Bacteroidota bacterium]
MVIVSVVVYSFLRWCFFIKNNLLIVDQDILDFWAPCFFAIIPVLIWIGPRIKILDLTPSKGMRSDPYAALLIFATIAILAPTIVTQVYLETATGKLTTLDRISQIDSVPQTKYYSVKHFYTDKSLARFKTRLTISGSHRSYLDMYLYVTVPVFDENHVTKTYDFKIGAPGSPINSDDALIVLNGKIIDKRDLSDLNPRSIKDIIVLKSARAVKLYGEAAKQGAILIRTKPGSVKDTLQVIHDDNMRFSPAVWFGIRYEKTISNNLSGDKKNERYTQFINASLADFKNKSLEQFNYLDRISYNSDLRNYVAAINSRQHPAIAPSPIVVEPVYKSFETRNGYSLPWIFGSFCISSAIFLVLILFKPLRNDLAYAKNSPDKTQQIIDEITGKINQ